MVPKMIYHLLLIFLHTVHLCFGVSLDLAEDVVQEYKLRCALVVVDHPHNINNIKREVFRKLSVQAKVVLNSDIQQMRLLSRQSKFVYWKTIAKNTHGAKLSIFHNHFMISLDPNF